MPELLVTDVNGAHGIYVHAATLSIAPGETTGGSHCASSGGGETTHAPSIQGMPTARPQCSSRLLPLSTQMVPNYPSRFSWTCPGCAEREPLMSNGGRKLRASPGLPWSAGTVTVSREFGAGRNCSVPCRYFPHTGSLLLGIGAEAVVAEARPGRCRQSALVG